MGQHQMGQHKIEAKKFMEIASMKIWYIFADKASANYERFVSCKLHDLKYVHDPVLITSNKANELNLLSQKSVQDVRKQIFALLEKLAEHEKSSYKELYDKEVSLQSSLQQFTEFYFFLCEVVDMQD